MSERQKTQAGKRKSVDQIVRETEDWEPPDPNAAESMPAADRAKLERQARQEDEGAWRTRFRLTLKQKLWAESYIGVARGNASAASRLAGFSDNNQVYLSVVGDRMLKNDKVRRYVAYLLAKRRGGPRETLAGIVELATTTADAFLDIVVVNGRAEARLNLKKAQEAAALGAIRELKIDPETGFIDTVKLYDRLAALQTLAKIHGQIVDKAGNEGDRRDGEESRLLSAAMTNPKLFRRLTDLYEELDTLKVAGPNAADAEHQTHGNGNGSGRN